MIANQLQTLKDTLNKRLDSLTIVPQKSIYAIEGFTINGKMEENVNNEANITINPVENGSKPTDHISFNPEVITITGEVSDFEITPRDSDSHAINQSVDYLTTIATPYLPNWTQGQIDKIQSVINRVDSYIDRVTEAVNKGEDIYNLFNKIPDSESNQVKFIIFMESLFLSATPVNVITKGKSRRALIQSFPYSITEESFLSFTLTFQEFTTVGTETINLIQIENPISNIQTSSVVDVGEQSQKLDPTQRESILYQAGKKGYEFARGLIGW